jgi:predicted secreted protein
VNVSTFIAIFFIIWWVVLFAVLPWGVKSQQESGDISAGTDPGAPAVPRLVSKLLWTTIITAVIFAVFYAAYHFRLITADDLIRWVNPPRQ